MEFVKRNLKSCCGKSALLYEVNAPMSKSVKDVFLNNKFTINNLYERSGLFQGESIDLIVKFVYGTNKITIKCKNKQCADHLIEFEKILIGI